MEDYQSLAKLNIPAGTAQLASLIAQFLTGPTPEVEHKLALFHPDHYLSILADTQQKRQVVITCCSAFRKALERRGQFIQIFNGILGSLQALYISSSESLSNYIELVLQKLFDIYLSDDRKLQAFQNLTNRLEATNDIRQCPTNQRVLKLSHLLVKSMNINTINNEICVGALIYYLKKLYNTKNKTQQPFDPNGRGWELLQQAMESKELAEPLNSFIDMQIHIIQIIKEIVEMVDDYAAQNEDGDMQFIPTAVNYIRRSKQTQTLFSYIICTTFKAKIYGQNNKINQLKKESIQFYADNYPFCLSKDFLLAAVSTITNSINTDIIDNTMQVISTVLLLIERSTSNPEFASFFYGHNQVLTMKLFQIITAKEAERQALENNGEYFAQIADDFCKTQESQSLKARAGSLLYNLAMYVDGSLTFFTTFSLMPLYDLERKAVLALEPNPNLRLQVVNSQTSMNTMLSLWVVDAESFTQASLLVLASLSDIIQKRPEFQKIMRAHIDVMLELFKYKQKVFSCIPPIVVCRYILLVSFFPSYGCLDPFIPLFSFHQGVAHTLLKALETMITFNHRKGHELYNYISNVSSKILLLGDKLTPILQTTIISRPQLLLCVKQKLIQKLVVWLLQFLQKNNVLSCNKIGNLLCKVIQKYPQYMSNDDMLIQMQLQTLAQYLSPLYRQLLNGQHSGVEEAVVEVAVSHASIMKVGLTQQTASDFIQLAAVVVERNQGTLGKCLELFSQLLATIHTKKLSEQKYLILMKVNIGIGEQLLKNVHKWITLIEIRDENIWQLICLVELILGTFQVTGQHIDPSLLNLSHLLELCGKSQSEVVQVKSIIVRLLMMRLAPNAEIQNWFAQHTLPLLFPPYEKQPICVYLLRSLCNFKNPETKVKLMKYCINVIIPNEHMRKYFKEYEDTIHVMGTSQSAIFAFQASKQLRRPLACAPTDVFEEFKGMFQREKEWAAMGQFLDEEMKNQMRMVLSMHNVSGRVRKVVKVSRPYKRLL